MSPRTEQLIQKAYAKKYGGMSLLGPFFLIFLIAFLISFVRAADNYLRTGHFEVPHKHVTGGRK
jgi:hypothetical protein